MKEWNYWTDEKFTKLKKLRETGLSFTEIGKELGMTKNAVLGKFSRERIKSGYKVTKKVIFATYPVKKTKRKNQLNDTHYYKVIGTSTCFICNKEYSIHSKFDRFCKPCKKSDMYIGSH